MLIPAILKKDEIIKKFQERYYTEDLMLESGCLENFYPNIVDCPDDRTYQYAIMDGDKLIGYFAYTIELYASNVHQFGLISFDKGNVTIGKDVFTELEKLIKTYHRIEWRMVGGNHVERSYDRFCERYNGTKHVFKDVMKDRQGNYRDNVVYEIIND